MAVSTVSRKWIARLAWAFWLFERASEKWGRGCIARRSEGLNFLDGALVLAAHRGARGKTPHIVRHLAEAGADLAAQEHSVFVVVASRGDEDLTEWIYRRRRPSSKAIGEAMTWARYFKRSGVVALIGRLQAEEGSRELSAHVAPTAVKKVTQRL